MLKETKISIIIPTLNEEYNLKRLFASLEEEKNYNKKFEVLVVDSCSTDGTEELCKTKPYVRYIRQKSKPGKARNIGIQKSLTENIVMLDADTEITPSWYHAVVDGLKHYPIVAGYSPDPEGKQMPRVPAYVYGQDITWPQCNIAYRKGIFSLIGYLREDMFCAEDCEFHYRCAQAGLVILYHPHMKVWHYERPTRKQWIKKQIKNGYGRYELNRVHPDLKTEHQHGLSPKQLVRLGLGAYGYLKAMTGAQGSDKV